MAGTQSAFREAFRHGELPAFSVACNLSFAFTNATYTKVTYNVKEFDPDNLFNFSDYTFRPRVSGLYMLAGTSYVGTASTNDTVSSFFKNGVQTRYSSYSSGGATASFLTAPVAAMVPLQAGDFVDLRTFQNTAITAQVQTSISSFFQGYLVRAA